MAGGGHLVVWCFSGIADGAGRVRLGGYPGAFRQVLGVRVEELCPLPPGATVGLDRRARHDLVGAGAPVRRGGGAAVAAAGVAPVLLASVAPGVEAVRREVAGGRSWLYLLNHTDAAVAVSTLPTY